MFAGSLPEVFTIYTRRPSFLLRPSYAAVTWVVRKERCAMAQMYRRLTTLISFPKLETVVPVHMWNIFNSRHRLHADINYSFRYFCMYAGYAREINVYSFFVFLLCFALFLLRFVSFHSIPNGSDLLSTRDPNLIWEVSLCFTLQVTGWVEPLSIDKQGYINRIAAVGSNLLVRISTPISRTELCNEVLRFFVSK